MRLINSCGGRCATVLLSVLLAFSTPATAHLLKVFAWVEGNQIVGNAYFAGGVAAAGTEITVLDDQGQLIAKANPDEHGEFRITIPGAANYRIEADTGDGHVAHWDIKAAEIAAVPETKPAAVAEHAHPHPASVTPEAAVAPSSASSLDAEALARVVQTAVAKEVGPLRQEVQQYADRVRLSDVLGGIGFIFGITGLALWWRSRKLSK
ncbi:hypothetical protein [Shewanella sp. YIC-542]|uniref:hypothetical protein n=1 Tax=Shewanella mytili TaxID=3377111 RepID=UPI00398EC490